MAAGNIAAALARNNYMTPLADALNNYYAEQERNKNLNMLTNAQNQATQYMQDNTQDRKLVTIPRTVNDNMQGKSMSELPTTQMPSVQEVPQQMRSVSVPLQTNISNAPVSDEERQNAVNQGKINFLKNLQGIDLSALRPQDLQLAQSIIEQTSNQYAPKPAQLEKIGKGQSLVSIKNGKITPIITPQPEIPKNKIHYVKRIEGGKVYEDAYITDPNTGKQTLIQSLPAGEREPSFGESMANVEREKNRESKLNQLKAEVTEGIAKIDGIWKTPKKSTGKYEIDGELLSSEQLAAYKESKIKPKYLAAADQLLNEYGLKSNQKGEISYLDAVRKLVNAGLDPKTAAERLGLDSDKTDAINLYFTIAGK